MAADESARAALSRAPRNPISGARIEVVVSRSFAVFGLVFAAQTVVPVIEQSAGLEPAWSVVIVVSIVGGLVASVIASLAGRGVAGVNGYVAFSWFFAMATWPLAITDAGIVAEDRPWPWFVLTVATAAAAVAWPVWSATTALVVLPLCYGIVRASPSGGDAPIGLVALDMLYAVLLGGTVLIIITLLRQAAASVDRAQSAALERYATAVRQHATEVERVEVDAIVHDSVLTTFLSAARAETPSARALAGRMARNAMRYLHEAATTDPEDTATVSSSALAARIRLAAAQQDARFTVRRMSAPDLELPAHSAEALYSAAVQAMVNSAQHAGRGPGVRRWLSVGEASAGRLLIEVGDSGAGFEPGRVLSARIGLRVSIVERTIGAGGEVEVDAHPGDGSVIRLIWPALPQEPERDAVTGADAAPDPTGGLP